jgi:hypothetical protein
MESYFGLKGVRMKRRTFVQSSLAGVAAIYGVSDSRRPLGDISLSNSFLQWDFEITAAGMRTKGVLNKLSRRYLGLSGSREIALTFSAARERIEIPWWKWTLGPETTSADDSPDAEGLRQGFHLPTFSAESNWSGADNLYVHSAVGQAKPAVSVYRGYAWFRQHFTLPQSSRKEEIFLVLGGYDQEDWNRYWVYLNGNLVGTQTSFARWRQPGMFVLQPGSEGYRTLNFGEGAPNTLAICVRDYDRAFGGYPRDVIDRALFNSNMVDQFIAVGPPYRTVSDFEVTQVQRYGESESPGVVFSLCDEKEQIEVKAHYELSGFTRRKWLEINNAGGSPRLLLDVHLDEFDLKTRVSEGGYGFPVLVDEEAFCGIEFPTALNQGMPGRLRLTHFPGRTIGPGAQIRTKVSTFGVARPGEAAQQFVDYIREGSPRSKKLTSIYTPFGINDYDGRTLEEQDESESLVLDALEDVKDWRQRGIQFDHFFTDSGWWQNQFSSRLDYREDLWPDGPAKVVEEVAALGMRYGTWFDATYPDWGMGNTPGLEASRRLNPDGYWPPIRYRNGVFREDWLRCMCVSAEPYAHLLKEAILRHVKESRVRALKLDNGRYYCNSTQHGHLPGKYSTEANYESIVDIVRAVKKEAPDAFCMGYWGHKSPYFCLVADTIFESGIAGEGAGLSDYPALVHRDSSTLLVDQASHFARLVPPSTRDSLGVWLTNTSWGSYSKAERWLEAMVMDLGRGSLLFPQIWGDLAFVPCEEVAVLRRLVTLTRSREQILLRRRQLLGDPWKNAVYGYAYFDGAHGLLFLNNVHFQSRVFKLTLDGAIGFAGSGPVRICRHFPETSLICQQGSRDFMVGQTVNIWLRPFEVAMFEIGPEAQLTEHLSFAVENLSEKPEILGRRLELTPVEPSPDSEIVFAEADRLTQGGLEKKLSAFRLRIPEFSQSRPVLAVVARHLQRGEPFREGTVADLSQIHARIGEKRVYFYTTPTVKATINTWSHWLVFRTTLNSRMQDKQMEIALTSYLPSDGKCEIEAWVLPLWWSHSGPRTQACKGLP